MWDHFDCLPHQYLCVTTLYCISTYVGPLCIARFTSSVPMWDHFALHQYLCGTTLYCTVYLTSTYVGDFVLYQYLYGTTLYCTVYLTSAYVVPLCIATVCICLISRPTYMWDHFDCLPHQYLCGTTLYCISTYVGPLCIALYCISTYVGPLCIALFTSPVPMWETLYCISTYMGPLCIALFTSPVPMWYHFVLQPYVYASSVGIHICGITLTVYLISTYV